MIEFIYKTRVEFYDVDSMDVVWRGNYVKFLEAARCAFLRYVGYDYGSFRADGFVLPIVKMEFKYVSPAFFGDELDVKVTLGECETMLKLSYEISSKNGLVCKAKTAQASVQIASKTTMFELPSGFYKALKGKYEI